jgi:predicted nuclease of predicted toxin-antitoxin system
MSTELKLIAKSRKMRRSLRNFEAKGRWLRISPQSLTIYIDESVNVAVAEGLRRRGVTAFSAKDLGKQGMTDEEQLKTAIKNKAVIFTNDADFLRIAATNNHFGVIYVHQRKLSVGECIKRLKVIAETGRREEMRNKIIFL